MYARQVSMELRPNSRADFTRRIELEILPLLCKQKQVPDENASANPAGNDAFATSLWDSKESAENDNRASFGEVTKLVSKLVAGTPPVKTYVVANSTFSKIAATRKAA